MGHRSGERHPRHDRDSAGGFTEDSAGNTLICYGGGQVCGPDPCMVSFQQGNYCLPLTVQLVIRVLLRPVTTAVWLAVRNMSRRRGDALPCWCVHCVVTGGRPDRDRHLLTECRSDWLNWILFDERRHSDENREHGCVHHLIGAAV